MESSNGETMSVEDMVRQAASEVLHSRVPEGFEWVEAYGQYYSKDCGFFYDPGTGLFYHSDSQTYYVFDDETQQYQVFRCMQKVDWSIRGSETRARGLLGDEVDRMGQEGADVCECLFSMVDMVAGKKIRMKETARKAKKLKKEAEEQEKMEKKLRNRNRKERRLLARNGKRLREMGMAMIETEDPNLVIYDTQQNWADAPPNDQDEGCSSDAGTSSADSDECESEDERLQMMEDEGYSQPPLLRIIDGLLNLSIVTICGASVGRGKDADIFVQDTSISRKALEFCFVAESNSYVVKRLCEKGRVELNDYQIQLGEDKEIEHGDLLRVGTSQFTIHVHYGNNTCPGCEPGLLQSLPSLSSSIPSVRPAEKGETARRRTLKMLKAAYGVNDHITPNQHNGKRAAGPAAHEIKRNRPVIPNPSDMYAGCTARPVPGASVPVETPKPLAASQNASLTEENKGFKLLQSMGWKKGEGLGKDSGGRVEPVMNELKTNRAGLGSASAETRKPAVTSQKEAILDMTRKRYEQISTPNDKK